MYLYICYVRLYFNQENAKILLKWYGKFIKSFPNQSNIITFANIILVTLLRSFNNILSNGK